MACFHAKDVPVGTKLYIASQSAEPIPEQAASIEGLTRYKEYVLENEGGIEQSPNGEYVKLADVERLLATQSAKQGAQPSAWISVEHDLPKKCCIAVYQTPRGVQRIIRAMYVRQYEIEATGDECDSETNEANDLEYIKAGWYECIDNWGDYSSVAVCEGTVTHWQPLPTLPGAASQAAPEQAAQVPADVRAALDRMCTPLDKSWLSGATAKSDARCMQIIKGYIESTAAPAAQVQADVRDQALEEAASICEWVSTNSLGHAARRIRELKSKRAASTDGEGAAS